MSSSVPKVIVVGGGVIGTSIGYFLARDGAEVTLIDRAGMASGTSSACEGLLVLQSKKPGIHLRIGVESIEMLFSMKEELLQYGDPELRRTGALFVIEDQESYDRLSALRAKQAKDGVKVTLLDRKTVKEMEPRLNPTQWGAAYTERDGKVSPMGLAFTMANGIVARGGNLVRDTTVTGLIVRGGRVTGVTTTKGPFHADVVVNAAGAWAESIIKSLGVNLPVQPRRGQILVTEKTSPMLTRPVIGGTYSHFKFGADIVSREREDFHRIGGTVVIDQHREGNVMLGGTREFVGFDKRVTLEGLTGIAKAVCNVCPSLRNINVIRSFSGFRPFTPDGLAILGPIPNGPEGLILATGHEGDGVTLAPITAKWMTDLIMGRGANYPVEEFSLARFDKAAGVAGA